MLVIVDALGLQPSWWAQGSAEAPEQGKLLLEGSCMGVKMP